MVLLSVAILPNATSLPKNIFLKKHSRFLDFVHDEVEIVDGCRVLGSVIGSDSAEQQKSLLKKLAVHANVSPQNVYKLFTSSVQHKLAAVVAPCFFDHDHCDVSCISFLHSCCGRSLWISCCRHSSPSSTQTSWVHFKLPVFLIISFSCKFMLKIFGASSLYYSVNSIEEYLREEVQELVHSFPGLNINPKSKSDVTSFLISESLRYENFIWHDLIINTSAKHPEVNPLEVTCLLEKLRGLPNLFCIVYCHREGAPEIFDSLRLYLALLSTLPLISLAQLRKATTI